MRSGDCDYSVIRSEGERHLLRCAACGHERWGTYLDPSMYKRRCDQAAASLRQLRQVIDAQEEAGPGTELTALLGGLGVAKKCRRCKQRAQQMNLWGVAGCREHFDTIVDWVRKEYKAASLKEKLTAALKALGAGLAFTIDWTDPIPSLVTEAIRRAEEAPRAIGERSYSSSPASLEGKSILLRFAHGFGDHVQFTVVLQHLQALRPDLAVDVECNPEMIGLFGGLCRAAYPHGGADRRQYDHAHLVEWWEPTELYADSPATKAEKYLREVFAMAPRLDLCSYKVGRVPRDVAGTEPFGLLHFTGTTARPYKDLPEPARAAAIAAVQAAGLRPIVVDWWTPGRDLVELARKAALCIGIDSGPGHAFAASGTPTILCWTRHHPLNFCGLNRNVLHLIPHDHPRYVRGDWATGREFFAGHYRYETYTDLAEAIRSAIHDVV